MKENKSINNLISGLSSATAFMDETRHETVYSKDLYSPFSFTVEKTMIDFIRDLVAFQRKKRNNYFYNQSDALREGIEGLREKYEGLATRPENIPIPTRRGKKVGPHQEQKKEKRITSFYLNEFDKEFIYNVIFHNIKGGNDDYGKESFFEEIVEFLKTKYNF